jgi:SAM-dependent methyltransferase
MAQINSTYMYHRNTPIDLMKEFTICESFSSPASAYTITLTEPRAYGAMLGDFLIAQNLLTKGSTILEIGGGYGSLMHGLLSAHGDLVKKVFMVDLSPGLLRRQRKALRTFSERITFIQGDIQELIPAITGVDLIIANEVIGDLDTMIDIDPGDPPGQARTLMETYALAPPAEGPFNLNTGAIRLVEAMCRKNIPVLLTEHSCDPIIPEDMQYLNQGLDLDSYPRRIPLYNHCEYTIRFSHLIKVAQAFGRHARTGSLIDLINLRKTAALKTIFTTRACSTDRQEIIYELLDHIREYRWLIIR